MPPGEDDYREDGQDRRDRQGGLSRELGVHVEALGPSAAILALTAVLDKLGERGRSQRRCPQQAGFAKDGGKVGGLSKRRQQLGLAGLVHW